LEKVGLHFDLSRPTSKIQNRKSKMVGGVMRKTILVVDDAEFNRDLVVQLLEDNYDIIVAENGAEALDKTQEQRPDLILMDLGMPVMDGWEATRRLKASDDLRHIPVIAVTSHAMVGDEIEARKAGCDDYLPKPIDEDLLISKIKKYLG
jgi:two-component system, cell cycle response regulator DivK